MSEKRLKTFISPVYVRAQSQNTSENSDRLIAFPDNQEHLCLLDDLLGGGIVLPECIIQPINENPTKASPPSGHSGLFMLIVGPPGSGKSTLALELCYRLASNNNPGLGVLGEHGISSVYLSAESPTDAILQNATSFGWTPSKIAGKSRGEIASWKDREKHSDASTVFVIGRDQTGGTQDYLSAGPFFRRIQNDWQQWMDASSKTKKPTKVPRVLVVDSLNVLPKKWDKDEVLQGLVNSFLPGNILMIAVLDSNLHSDDHRYWEYFADLEICVGQRFEREYLSRMLHIVKARYQDHSDGEHRLKINPKPGDTGVQSPMSPYIKQGGVFVFPSVHRHLSIARGELGKTKTRLNDPLKTPMNALNAIIEGGGFPAGSCTAIVGSRGGMKSHLAYYSLLSFLYKNPDERALIISLRDPESAAKQTLSQILLNQQDDANQKLDNSIAIIDDAKSKIESFFLEDRIELLFFWPGYISPDEFFHLVRVAVDRAPGNKKPASVVLVNGLEQLNARFPLCAKEEMFVSGLLTLLRVKGVTSIVVSGGEIDARTERQGLPSGLLPMADLIIESSFRLLPADSVWTEEILGKKQQMGTGDETHVVYQIVREPGARECRGRVLLYMGRQGDGSKHPPGNVVAKPLITGFPHGRRPD